MSIFTTPITKLDPRISLPIFGCLLGVVAAYMGNPLPLTPRDTIVPAPYRIPRTPGGTALRMAMVHDVLLGRYFTHSPAYYTQRNETCRATIASPPPTGNWTPDTGHFFDAYDDLAVGLERLGNHEQAAATIRQKLALLPPLPYGPIHFPPPGKLTEETELQLIAGTTLTPLAHQHYTAHANLGTFLIHQSFPGVLAGNPDARNMMDEGLDHIDQSIALNPSAHFGRERWQAIVVRHFLATLDHPEFATKYSMIGQDLNEKIYAQHASSYVRHLAGVDIDTLDLDHRRYLRHTIQTIHTDSDWADATAFPYAPYNIPFDEPTLALLGMWTQGGGPNPHSALALGRLMEHVGQRHIAWEAYQRALDLAANFSPNPATRDALSAYCRDRQLAIAQQLAPADPASWQTRQLADFTAERDFATAYLAKYHAFETAQIAAHVPLDSPHFYDAFFASAPPLASAPGNVDDIRITHIQATTLSDFAPLTTLGAGLGLALGTLLRRKPKRPSVARV